MYWERSAPQAAQTRDAELGMLNGKCLMLESEEVPNICHAKFNIEHSTDQQIPELSWDHASADDEND
jgi:hypothetical protein